MYLRIFVFAMAVALCGAMSAQTLAVSPTSVTYRQNNLCSGPPTFVAPTLEATGGSGSYSWTVLTAPPANLTLNLDGTFAGTIDQMAAGPAPWTFDVEVMDTVSSTTAQATITMDFVATTPGCAPVDDDGNPVCSTSARYDLLYPLLLLVALAVFATTRAEPST